MLKLTYSVRNNSIQNIHSAYWRTYIYTVCCLEINGINTKDHYCDNNSQAILTLPLK